MDALAPVGAVNTLLGGMDGGDELEREHPLNRRTIPAVASEHTRAVHFGFT
jgi:hypothetical protein